MYPKCQFSALCIGKYISIFGRKKKLSDKKCRKLNSLLNIGLLKYLFFIDFIYCNFSFPIFAGPIIPAHPPTHPPIFSRFFWYGTCWYILSLSISTIKTWSKTRAEITAPCNRWCNFSSSNLCTVRRGQRIVFHYHAFLCFFGVYFSQSLL